MSCSKPDNIILRIFLHFILHRESWIKGILVKKRTYVQKSFLKHAIFLPEIGENGPKSWSWHRFLSSTGNVFAKNSSKIA
jgi:hypothetical protein